MGKYAKAIVAALVAGLSVMLTAIEDGSGITGAEWVQVALATAAGLGFTFIIPNKPAPATQYSRAGR